MMNILVKDYYYLTNGIMLFTPVKDENNKVTDFVWDFLNYKDHEGNHLLLGENPGLKSLELFERYMKVLQTGEADSFLFSYMLDDATLWYQTSVAKFNGGLVVSCNNVTEQKEAEYRLVKSEETYRLLTENSTDIICRLDLKSHFLYVSPSSKRILGLPPEELIGRSFYQYVHPEDIEEVKKQNEKLLTESIISTMQFKFRRNSGQYIWIETITKPIRNELGNIIEVQSSVRDITERKMVEEELFNLNKELERRAELKAAELKTILNNAPVILWSVNKEGTFTFIEGKGINLLGYTEEVLEGRSVLECFKNYPLILKNIESALSGNSFMDNLVYENRHYQEYFFPVKNADGEISGMAAIATDITEQALLQEKLMESEAKYRAMVNGIPQIIWTADANGQVDFFNKNWYDYTGLSEDESLKNAWTNAVFPDDLPNIYTELKVSVETGKMLMFEARYRRCDGEYRWHLVRVWSARNERDEVIKWLGSATDIHDQKASLEEVKDKNHQLWRINNDLDNFIYTASHDLRAPISNMEGLLIAIKNELKAECGEDIGLMMKMTEDSLLRLKATINELTEISQVQKNFNGAVEIIHIPEVIENFKTDHRQEVAITHTTIKMRLEVENVYFTSKNFKTILYNLLSNAIKYKHPDRDPLIEVTTKKLGRNCLLLSVSDNGLGLKEGDSDKIFGMFKRLHTHVEGTGVGLYIVKRVIENVEGRIEVKSKLGEGTTFNVYLKNVT